MSEHRFTTHHAGPRDHKKEARVRPSDLPRFPRTREDAEAQIGVCRAHLDDIARSLGSRTASNFRSVEDFTEWRDRTQYAQSQWETRMAIAQLDFQSLLTREAKFDEQHREIARLRERLIEIQRLQEKARTRRNMLMLERMLMLAVLTGAAPPNQREAAIRALQNRIPPEKYVHWLERAKAADWRRGGPLGSFEEPGGEGNGDAQQ